MDRWDGGTDYDVFMGRWSRLVAVEFVDGLGMNPGLRWLDVGCGT
jgi:ubiquinone/menaquinone biosynthesis C-methylase UbiE